MSKRVEEKKNGRGLEVKGIFESTNERAFAAGKSAALTLSKEVIRQRVRNAVDGLKSFQNGSWSQLFMILHIKVFSHLLEITD